MAAWTLRPTAIELQLNLGEAAKRHGFVEVETLPPADYYMYEIDPLVLDDEDYQSDPLGVSKGVPVLRNMIENSNKLFIERNLYAHLNSTFNISANGNNAYAEEHIDLEALVAHPPSFIFFGKPGVGKSTLSAPLAKKLNSVLLSPESIASYYLTNGLPDGIKLVFRDGTFSTQTLLALLLCRLYDLDVFHRGYVIDGFPIIHSKEVSIEDQMNFLYSLPRRPDYVIILHMQDIDLYNRRRLQKYDPVTNVLYTMQQYMAAEIQSPTARLDDFAILKDQAAAQDREKSDGSRSIGDLDAEETGDEVKSGTEMVLEFKPLDDQMLGRLLSRQEDRPIYIKLDLEKFKGALPYMQAFVDTFDSRKVLELSAYVLPSALFKLLNEFLRSFGVTSVPLPVKLITNTVQDRLSHLLLAEDDLDEFGEEAPCVPYSVPKEVDLDWDVITRTCVIRGRVDPRFRWKVTAWKNLCPVALKFGRSIMGKPELAVGFLDKIYYLSSEEAFKQFELNPRPFLLPAMPTSPVKFYVIGHPLAGKTRFSNELAAYLGAYVIDMKREVRRKFHLVKHDHLFRIRLKAVFEITKEIDKQNFIEWKHLERSRREELLEFIELMSTAEVKEEKARRLTVHNFRTDAMTHEIGDTFSGICQQDDGLLGFSYKEFKENWRQKRIWPHQKRLELAWKLFNERKLKYRKEKPVSRLRKHKRYYEDKGEEGEGGGDIGEVSEEEVVEEEEEARPRPRRKKRSRRRRFCKSKTEVTVVEEQKIKSAESSVFGEDDEADESILLRFPNLDIPPELILAHPKPSSVTEQDPLVAKLIAERLAEAETWADSLPPELYTEILIRAVSEVEPKYIETNSQGPLSGGWVIDNLDPDIEKFKAILRHPVTEPDNVVVLMDNSVSKDQLLENLKQVYLATRTNNHYEDLLASKIARHCQMVPIYGQQPIESVGNYGDHDMYSGSTDELNGEFLEEGDYQNTQQFLKMEIIGEQEVCEEEEAEKDTNNSNLEKTESEMLQQLLPLDVLVERFEEEISKSLQSQELRDKLRQISITDSLLDVTQKEILQGWLNTFGLLPPTAERSDNPLRTTNAETGKGKRRRKCQRPFPIPNYNQKDWTPRILNYEFLSYPRNKFLAERENILVTRGSSASITSDDIWKAQTDHKSLADGFEYEYQGEDTDLLDRTHTPMSLLVEEVNLDPEGLPIKIPSLKAKFLNRIRKFDEFWNMVIPILNKDKINYIELGVLNEESVLATVRKLWKSLESRFLPEVTKLHSNDLKFEYEEWMDANKIWKFAPDLIHKNNEVDDGEESGSDNEGEEHEYDNISKFFNQPEEYRKQRKRIERMRYFGDSGIYCPVTLKNQQLVRKGKSKFAAKYLSRTYYLADEVSRNIFVSDPNAYLPKNDGPLKPPCLRICVTGSPGCAQEEVSLEISKKHNVYFINFRQRLHEVLKVQVGQNVGPGMLNSVKNASFMLGKKKSPGEVSDLEYEVINKQKKEQDGVGSSDSDTELLGEDGDRNEMMRYDAHTLKNLGIMDAIHLAHCPQTEPSKVEASSNRNWKKMNSVELGIKNFLERGKQLPEEVLNIFLPTLWMDEPFKSKGFILVGFPNTGADVKYLAQNNFFPEAVYVVESKAKTMINRLLRRTVDDWFSQNPGEKKKIKDNLRGKVSKVFIPFQQRKLTENEKERLMNEYVPLEESDDESLKSKDRIYKDTSIAGKISRNLHHWHRLYSKDLKNLKMGLNEFQIEWSPIQADISLFEAKRQLRELLTNSIIHRQSLLDTTFDLSLGEAETLLEKGFFRLSKFGRMCPVEVKKGNRAVNLWHAPEVTKVPILYRGFIYYLAGVENAKAFLTDPWGCVQKPPQTPTVPLYVVVLGHAKSGKTELCKRLAEKLGLVYISTETMTHDVVEHSFLSHILDDDEAMPSQLNGSSMILADEVIAYLRGGYLLPQYMSYRILEIALMEPKAQFHGAVFDNYPLADFQLQELLERGIVPAIVVNLQMNAAEGHRRAELSRFDPNYNYRYPVPDSNESMNYMAEDYEPLTKHCMEWYADETQCLVNVDASQSPIAIFNLVKQRCYDTMAKVQQYIYSGLKGLPVRVDGLSPLTSLLHGKLSHVFSSYDPVALNDLEELVQPHNLNDLTHIVEYRGELYAFVSEKNTEKFLSNPEAYTLPRCKHVPPTDVPISCELTEPQMLLLKSSWGFLDFDPVLYSQGNYKLKALQRGSPLYTVEYRTRLFFFTNPETRDRFMRKPQMYTNIPIPTKLPSKIENQVRPLDCLSPAGYLIASGLTNEVARMLDTVAKMRPKFPFMSSTKSSLLYLGYYLKTLNMKSSLDVRTHYRKAMMHMIRTQGNTRDLIQEVNQLHGKQYISEDVRRRLNLFVSLAEKPDKEKILDPYIPGLNLNYDTVLDDPKDPILRDMLTQILKGRSEENDNEEDIVNYFGGFDQLSAMQANTIDMSLYSPPPYLDKNRLI